MNNNSNNDICEYYLPKELMAKMKKRPGFSVVQKSVPANIDKIEMGL